jgi:neutral ceramidase
MRSVLKQTAKEQGKQIEVVLAGLSNMYTSYITTPEEYQIQRYEAASTLYGPHTLTIYIQQFQKLLISMFQNVPLNPGPLPPNQDSQQISLNTGVFYDGHPFGEDYGYVKIQPHNTYSRGETVHAKFISGNPRNNLMHDSSYFTVEQKISNENWKVIATDANWETK